MLPRMKQLRLCSLETTEVMFTFISWVHLHEMKRGNGKKFGIFFLLLKRGPELNNQLEEMNNASGRNFKLR